MTLLLYNPSFMLLAQGLSFIQPSPHFIHQVIFLELSACTLNGSRQLLCGGKRFPNMTLLLKKDANKWGMAELHAAQVLLFFSFKYGGELYPYALIH
jgi:hypothetical protein